MKKEKLLKRRKRIKNIFGFLSLSTALFVFQACYGPPQGDFFGVEISGKVLDKNTSEPIPNLRFVIDEDGSICYSDESGFFSLYANLRNQYLVKIRDVDSTENNRYADKDTLVTNADSLNYINLNLYLEQH